MAATPAGQPEGSTKAVLETRRQQLSFGPAWYGGWHVGEGYSGVASVWVEEGTGGTITDRLVLKDSAVREADWNNIEDNWIRKPKAPQNSKDIKDLIPIEAATMLRLRSRVGAAESIVKLRNWRIEAAAKRYRLYLEFCPFGDLYDYAMGHPPGLSYLGSRNKEEESLDAGIPAWLPEPFLWHIFECLATAGMLMERGELDPEPAEPAWWDLIVHRDIKVGNVFLGLPMEGRYAGFPTPKLGDFGLALIIPGSSKRDTEYLALAGTPGCQAPEICDRAKLTSATNVWAVGIVIWSLIELKDGDEDLEWGEMSEEYKHIRAHGLINKDEPKFTAEATAWYSHELRRLVLDCTRFDPSDRPTFWDILRRIRRCTRGKTNPRTSGLRDADRSDPGFKLNMRPDIVDKWELGSRLRDGRSPPDELGDFGGTPPPPSSDDESDSSSDEPGGERGAEVGAPVAAAEASAATVEDPAVNGAANEEAANRGAAEETTAAEAEEPEGQHAVQPSEPAEKGVPAREARAPKKAPPAKKAPESRKRKAKTPDPPDEQRKPTRRQPSRVVKKPRKYM